MLQFWDKFKKPKQSTTGPGAGTVIGSSTSDAHVQPPVVPEAPEPPMPAVPSPVPAEPNVDPKPTSRAPHDIVSMELEQAVNAELSALDDDALAKECELAMSHPKFKPYCDQVRLFIGESDETPQDERWVFGDEFDDLVMFKAYLRATGNQDCPETIDSVDTCDMAVPVPGDAPPYTGPSIPGDLDGEGLKPVSPGHLPVVPLKMPLASIKFSSDVVNEFHDLLQKPREEYDKRYNNVHKWEWWQRETKAEQIRDHPSCAHYESYITTLGGFGSYKFGSEDQSEEIATFEFWLQAEMNIFKGTPGIHILVDAPYGSPAHVPPTVDVPTPVPAAVPVPDTPMRSLAAALTRQTTVDLQGSPAVVVPSPSTVTTETPAPSSAAAQSPPPPDQTPTTPASDPKAAEKPEAMVPAPDAVRSSMGGSASGDA